MIVLLGALLMAAGAAMAILNPAMLVSPHDEINAAVHIYAEYVFSRTQRLPFCWWPRCSFDPKALSTP